MLGASSAESRTKWGTGLQGSMSQCRFKEIDLLITSGDPYAHEEIKKSAMPLTCVCDGLQLLFSRGRLFLLL